MKTNSAPAVPAGVTPATGATPTTPAMDADASMEAFIGSYPAELKIEVANKTAETPAPDKPKAAAAAADPKETDTPDAPESEALIPDEITSEADADDEANNEAENTNEAEAAKDPQKAALLADLQKERTKRREYKAQAEEAKAELEQVKADLERAKAATPTLQPTRSNPLSHINSPEGLEEVVAQAEQALAWCRRNRAGTIVNDVEYTPEMVAEEEELADAMLRKHVPARREYLNSFKETETTAKTKYPQLFKPGDKAASYRLDFLKSVPEIQSRADHNLVIGDAYIGSLVREGKAKIIWAKAPQGVTPAKTAAPKEKLPPDTATPAPAAKHTDAKPAYSELKQRADAGDPEAKSLVLQAWMAQ